MSQTEKNTSRSLKFLHSPGEKLYCMNWSQQPRQMAQAQLRRPPDHHSAAAGCAAVWQHFTSNTSFGGVGRMFHSKQGVSKFMWTVIFVGLSAATFVNTYEVVALYLTYPVTTETTATHEESLLFPSVTVCNRNPVPCHRLTIGYLKYRAELGRLMKHSHCWESAWKPRVLEMVTMVNHSSIQTWKAVWEQKIQGLLDAGNWSALEIENVDDCKRKLGLDERQIFVLNMTTYAVLVEECDADMTTILFPEFEPQTSQETEWDKDDGPTAVNGVQQKIVPAAAENGTTTNNNGMRDSRIFLTEYASLFVNQSMEPAFSELIVPLKSFVVNCFFQGEPCRKRRYFLEEIVPQYGTCYTFNSKFSRSDPNGGNRTTFSSGKVYGLTLDLMMNQDGYMPSVAASGAGGRIALASPGVRPKVVEDGHYFAPHTETDLAMHFHSVTRKPSPYKSKCWKSWDTQTDFIPIMENSVSRMRTLQNISIYTSEECHELCESRLLIRHCDCLNPYFVSPYYYKGVDITKGRRICDLTGSDQACFADFVKAMTKRASLACPCNLACERDVYTAALSTSTWPSDAYMEKVDDNYFKRLLLETAGGKSVRTVKSHKERVTSEFARVNVYFRTMNVEKISEEAIYDAYGILSSTGGSLSLYLGICGVTIFEIAELVVLMVLASLGFIHKKEDRTEKGVQAQGRLFFRRTKSVPPAAATAKTSNATISTISLGKRSHKFHP